MMERINLKKKNEDGNQVKTKYENIVKNEELFF